MKLFSRFVLAPALLGMATPMAASAAELNLTDVNRYSPPVSTKEQVTSITQFSDVQPTSWAYQALSNLVERYGCVAGYPNGTFKGNQPLTRWEAAALLNACLDRITEVTDELQRLLKEYQKELAILRGRVDGLEAKVGELEATQFSTTTKLQGEATFVLGGVDATGDKAVRGSVFPNNPELNNRSAASKYKALYGATTFSYDLRLNFLTSFSGKDLLYTRLRSGNFNNAFNGNGLNLTALDKASNGVNNNSDAIGVDRLYYSFPWGKDFTFVLGARARNTEHLGVTPSLYGSGKGERILDLFALNGAPGTYNKATGSMGAVIWKQNVKKGQGRFSASASYVAPQGNVGTPNDGVSDFTCSTGEGGIGTDCSRSSFLTQLAYTAPQWSVSAAYRYGQAASNFRRGTNFVASNSWFLANGESNSVALNAYWQPKKSGWFPSISLGWGYNSLSGNSIRSTGFEFVNPYVTESQSWFAGLQWTDVFAKGNSAGMAVGQPTFATALTRGSSGVGNTTPADGNYAWEWWYKFQVTDNISVTPAIFYLSRPLGQLTGNGNSFSTLGYLVQTTFKF
ncbi:iron uptake porin [Cyanobium sp. Morenito 9A2]|uniref:iron uptake porin n=1 Tax=Cyanobium sp. Morenito 9A2 TaxID=2823718 RepID=UPI0020CD7691|nr:iron uptake porin [Cyanobium sp. Morenito 9A2]MCP9851092.1 carbohydrate porin [Cyanobium sp. Morenito 9A2]